MTTQEEIKDLAGREVSVIKTTFKGKSGYMPMYINFNIQNRVSELFSSTEEECLDKFLVLLRNIKGDTDDTELRSE